LPLVPYPGCAVFLLRAAADDCLGYRPRPLVELHLPLEYYPATPTRPPRRPSPLMGFCSLQHLRNPRSTCREPSQPAAFRLQGLGTLLTVFSLAFRAGFVSHRQRSWDSPFGGFLSREVFAAFRLEGTHIPFSPAVFPPPKRQTGPTGLGFWVHASRGCLATARGIKPTVTGASLGFCPSRACLRKPWSRLLRTPSRVLGLPSRLLTGSARTSEFRSAFASPHPTDTGVPTGRSNPSGVSAPARS
jgi:hypothetical protein